MDPNTHKLSGPLLPKPFGNGILNPVRNHHQSKSSRHELSQEGNVPDPANRTGDEGFVLLPST